MQQHGHGCHQACDSPLAPAGMIWPCLHCCQVRLPQHGHQAPYHAWTQQQLWTQGILLHKALQRLQEQDTGCAKV